jgi:hypothetical protein
MLEPSLNNNNDLTNRDLETGEIMDESKLEPLDGTNNQKNIESPDTNKENQIMIETNEVDQNKHTEENLNEKDLKNISDVALDSKENEKDSDLNGSDELKEDEIENVPEAESSLVTKINDSIPKVSDDKSKRKLSPILFSVRAENPDYNSSEEEDENVEGLKIEKEKAKLKIAEEQTDDLNKLDKIKKVDFKDSKVKIEDTKISEILPEETANIVVSNEANCKIYINQALNTIIKLNIL